MKILLQTSVILAVILFFGIFGLAKSSFATTYTIAPGRGDSYATIEAAKAGDTVLIAPGTYNFRLWLHQVGTASAPITIKAQDPNNRPVFDYFGQVAQLFSGSYNSGDAYRGCWQVRDGGAYYIIDGIVIKGCNGIDQNSAGIRLVGSEHLTIRNSLFQNNENGVFGSGYSTLIEYSEFDHNGNGVNDQAHNIYIGAGDYFTLRYSYLHDSNGGQNFHSRAWNSTIEYNWFSRAGDYEGDIMTPIISYLPNGAPQIQYLTLRGNFFLTHSMPGNEYKVIALFNDAVMGNLSMDLTAIWNTFVIQENFTPGAVIQVRNDGLISANVKFSNNIIASPSTRNFVEISPTPANYTLSGTKNWFVTGSNVGSLINTIFGTVPGFTNAAAKDFTLASSSAIRGIADASVAGQPTKEYYQNEINKMMYRIRTSVNDLGAFESTTVGSGIGSGGSGSDLIPPSAPTGLSIQ